MFGSKNILTDVTKLNKHLNVQLLSVPYCIHGKFCRLEISDFTMTLLSVKFPSLNFPYHNTLHGKLGHK